MDIKIVYKNIDDLISPTYNPRKISEKDLDHLKKSLSGFGAVDPAIVNINPERQNIIIGGNQRIKAAKSLGEKTFPCVEVNLSVEKERELNIRLNKNSGEWDYSILSTEFENDDLRDWGFSPEDLPKISATSVDCVDADEVDSCNTDIVLGDIYQIGNHRLMCGDSTNIQHVTSLMCGDYAELLFTSPPYSDMRDYDKNVEYDLSVDNLSEFVSTYYPFCEYQSINLGIKRSKNNIVSYWDKYIESAKSCGYNFLSWNVWARSSAGSVGNQSAFFPILHEFIFVFGKKFKNINRTEEKKSKTALGGSTKRQKDGTMKITSIGKSCHLKEMGSVLFVDAENGSVRKLHPAVFPVELPFEYIAAITNIGDVVVDPFGGSGTTMVASEYLSRKCYTMELSPKYCQVIIDRMVKLNPKIEVERIVDAT